LEINEIKIMKYNEGKPFCFNEEEFKDEELSTILR
jgi:hypothetical protein